MSHTIGTLSRGHQTTIMEDGKGSTSGEKSKKRVLHTVFPSITETFLLK